jgi:3-dehydroquinate dehydratase-1
MSAQRVDNRYCLPIIEKRKAAVQKTLQKEIERFRFAEVWVDYIEDIDPGFITSLIGSYPHRLIIVFRRQNLEPMKMSPEERWQIISSLSRKQVLVDFDIASQTDEIARVQAERLAIKSILSYHNYSFTPSDTELRSITRRMRGWGAHISKISTLCKNQRDALRLLALLIDLREAGQKSIILGMGKHGTITRIFGTVWGNEMTFTPVELTARTAAGQLTVDKLDSIMQALG